MKKVTSIILLVLSTFNCFSQVENIKAPEIIPPSPHVRNFLKYGETPVSNYTGVPSIQIPIHTIQLKDITLPITLSYNASGIKVEEEASRVGLGWVLNAGGMISVTVMGKHHDFTEWAYFNDGQDNLLNDFTGATYLSSFMFTGPKNTPPISYAQSGMSMDILYSAIVTDNYGSGCDHGTELAPDVYNYSFGGYSGKFIFSHSGKIIKENEDNVLIIPEKIRDASGYDILKSWKCITPDGTIYFFEIVEKTTFTDRPTAENYNSCYYLSKIQTVNGSTIDFNYKKEKSTLYRFNKANDNLYIGPSLIANYAYNELVYLENISYPGGKVRFQHAFDREDYAPEPKLISVYIDDEQGNNKSKWELNYDYFIANKKEKDNPTLNQLNELLGKLSYYNGSWNNNFYTESWNKKRLKLQKVTHTNTDNKSYSYKFFYNETYLPTKLSTSIDHWGYYNGALNDGFIPGFYQNISQKEGGFDIVRRGNNADREANSQYNQAFLLNEIVYPTGGKSKFNFESNTYDGDNFENDPYKKDYMYGDLIQEASLIHGVGLNNAPVDWVQTELLKCPPKMTPSWKAKINVKVRIVLDDSYNTRNVGEPKFAMSIISKDGLKKLWSFTYQAPYLPNRVDDSNRTYEYLWSNIETDFNEYEIRAVGTLRAYIKEAEIKVERVISQPYLVSQGEKIGGAMRIGRIDNYDTNGNYISGKIYKYTKGNLTYNNLPVGQTSGKLMFYPRYNKDHMSVGTNGLRGTGYSVGYSTVHVVDINKEAVPLGRTVYEYINIPDIAINYTWIDKFVADRIGYDSAIKSKDENPPGLDGYKHSENGTLLKESKMLLKNNEYQEQEVIEYKYLGLGGGPSIVWGVLKNKPDGWWKNSVGSLIPCINDHNLNVLRNGVSIESYNSYAHSTIAWAYLYPAIRPMQYKLNEKIHKLYEENGVIETITNYNYNLKDQIIKETLKSNSKELRSIDYKYPPDISSNSIINKLTEANRINIPVETKQTINGQIFETINEYALFNNIPELSIVKTSTGTDRAIEARIRYHQYDVYGNPIQVSMNGGMNVVYLWSYNGQYPIAEIKNATYADVMGVLGQSLIDRITRASVPLDADMLAVNSLRNNTTILKDILVTTYTYKPQVGITSATDPSGKTTYYSYDKFDRLKESYLDYGGKKIMQAYDYFYSK